MVFPIPHFGMFPAYDALCKRGVAMTIIKRFCCDVRTYFKGLFGSEWISYDAFWSRVAECKKMVHW